MDRKFRFGWSFLSIAKVPMTWTEGDLWTTEVRCGTLLNFHETSVACKSVLNIAMQCMQVELPANIKVEYKYVILEEQVRPLAPVISFNSCCLLCQD